jgi:hypothetical protein
MARPVSGARSLANPSVFTINLPDNARSQVSLQLPHCRAGHAKALRDEGKNLRKIADAFYATSVKRILERA